MTQYPVVKVHANIEIPESLGTKEKFWISYDGKLCLLKFGREGTGEDWAEKVASTLCYMLDLPHAHYELALFKDRRCVLTPTIVPEGGRLILGNELIAQTTKPLEGAAHEYRQREHTVSRVLAALVVNTRPMFRSTWQQFLGYLMLDAWIGNTDRHHENWGIIRHRNDSVTLAPTFDHASSLGRELTDNTRERRLTTNDPRFTPEAFALKARSALFADTNSEKPLSPIDAFALAARAYPPGAEHWLARLAAISNDQILEACARVPSNFISDVAREFAVQVLRSNRARLLNLRKNA